MTIGTALAQGVQILESSAIPVPRLTAEVLLSHALQRDRTYLYTHADDELSTIGWIHFGRYLSERLHNKPTQYITHRQEFYGRDFYVDQGVLIPRPETEHVVDAALCCLKQHPVSAILDVGTGSGAIAITIALECKQHVLASDISYNALSIAERNRGTYGAEVSLFCGDLLNSIRPQSIDLLISNPPYVPAEDAANIQVEVRDWEPRLALFAGDQGLDVYRRLLSSATLALRRGATIVLELGYRSLHPVLQMIVDEWSDVRVISDLAGIPRVMTARLTGRS